MAYALRVWIMRILRCVALCLIALLSHPFDGLALTPATSRQAVMDTSWVYVALKWTCHNTYTSTSKGNFIEGSRYVGEAYRYGGNDHWRDFLDKVEVQKLKPRQQAGIDCSAFVSRCWGISRQTTGSLHDLSHAIPREMLQTGDILNNRYQHVVLVESVPTDYAVIVREATGGQISRVVRRSTTWSRYNGYVPRTLVDLSPDSAAVREYAVGVSDLKELEVRARIWNDGGVPISGVVGFYVNDLGAPIGADTVRADPRTWADVHVPWNVVDLPAGEYTLLIRVDETRPVESDTTNNLTTVTYTLPGSATSVAEDDAFPPLAPIAYVLKQNRPNPFNASTMIEYELPKRADVVLAVYDVLGRAVRTWAYRDLRAGYYREVWDGRDDMGRIVSSGIYLCRLRADAFRETKRMILLK